MTAVARWSKLPSWRVRTEIALLYAGLTLSPMPAHRRQAAEIRRRARAIKVTFDQAAEEELISQRFRQVGHSVVPMLPPTYVVRVAAGLLAVAAAVAGWLAT